MWGGYTDTSNSSEGEPNHEQEDWRYVKDENGKEEAPFAGWEEMPNIFDESLSILMGDTCVSEVPIQSAASVYDTLPHVFLCQLSAKRYSKVSSVLPHSQQLYVKLLGHPPDPNSWKKENCTYQWKTMACVNGEWKELLAKGNLIKRPSPGIWMIDNKEFQKYPKTEDIFFFIFFGSDEMPKYKAGPFCSLKNMLVSSIEYPKEQPQTRIFDILTNTLINQAPLDPADLEFLQGEKIRLANLFLDEETANNLHAQMNIVHSQYFKVMQLIAQGSFEVHRSQSKAITFFQDNSHPESPLKRKRPPRDDGDDILV
eukprot:TRINITY_DN2674_c0_g1_i1.p1 TRINITY_DN2674_c0_g1~~TRINITY_DN2674_c0_g1_i1.p1  ORF type:complete len:313 (-),score=58.90 TRINITY_DN2674_c0_g1_i1:76-1014(-)